MAIRLSIDIETCSEADLRKVGTYVYAQDPTTKILCVGYAIDDAPAKVWRAVDEPMPEDLYAAVHNKETEFYAWNAANFEMVLLPNLIEWPIINTRKWHCTMTRAAYWGLPMKLETAADALRLGWRKDMAGHRLMLSMSKPRANGTYWHESQDKKEAWRFPALCNYCIQDVEVERDIAKNLPPLPEDEEKIWRLDYTMMRQGMPVDQVAITALKDVAENQLKRLDEDMRKASFGMVSSVGNVGALTRWCHERMKQLGIHKQKAEELLPAVDKESIDAFLSELEPEATHFIHRSSKLSIPSDIPQLLRIRKEAAKSSVAKLQAMEKCSTSDARIHGLTMFYGASRTGRWAGRLVQVQNLPRGIKGVDPNTEIEKVITARAGYAAPTGVSRLEVVSACLRGCFKPHKGKFYVGDFSQIEARVVAWLAGQQDILDVFESGEDVYTFTANKLGSKDRQFGKVLVLACGFGMGPSKFKDTAATYGLNLTDEQAKEAVTLWRGANLNIVQFWKDLEKAARLVLDGATKSRVVTVGKVALAMGAGKLSGCLLIRLPSGRQLVYREARLLDRQDGFPPAIAYAGQNQMTRKWETTYTYGGKICENIVQACASDLLRFALTKIPFTLHPLVTIHDEIVCVMGDIQYEEKVNIRDLTKAMTMPPPWADGLPIGADVKSMDRYGK
jgi:DNA polymerase